MKQLSFQTRIRGEKFATPVESLHALNSSRASG